ncbi:uncharacterized protein LOC123229502 isoform X2 [Mangifera indica]|uniref:uncharacterized protein LOC123229502 isoform X2 n=1 Tax=Mangifera indica TaxID=29780 RepID=UPI001CFBED9B|nr:uncharacterized protein LOC123229502 isoform X2 [Mangifera indica]
MITEMDSSRDMRRGVSRFSRQQMKQSGQRLCSATAGLDGVGDDDDFVSLEKSKKQRLIKKLSVVDKASSTYQDSETGCKMSSDRDRNNEFPSQSHSLISNGTAKSFTFPKKQFFDDYNGVDHASVPRKLRSAMKKRHRKSISRSLPDSKKLNHTMGGVVSPKKNGLKKSKLNMKQGGLDWTTKQALGSITKDEEEVVETLYALAEMFSDNDTTDKNKLENSPSEAKHPALPECRESPTTAFEVSTEDLSSTCPMRTSEAAPSANLETLLKETAKINSLDKPTIEEKSVSHDNEIFPMKSDTCVPQVNLCSMMPSLAKTSYNDDKPSCDCEKLHVLTEISCDSGSKQSVQRDASQLTMGAAVSGSQFEQQDMVMDSRKKSLALWPGLSPIVVPCSGCPGSSLQSSTANDPAWLDAAICVSNPCSFGIGPLYGKVSKGTTRRLLKRCAAHVYITHLIQDLKIPEKKQILSLQPNQVKLQHENQKPGLFKAINDFERVDKGANGVLLTNNATCNTTERDANDATSGILQQKRLYQDQPQNTEASRANTLQKQSFNFLSLSAGSVGVEANNSFNGAGNNGLEPSSQFQVSYLHSQAQHKFIPLSMSQTRYTSSVYPDHISASTSTQQLPPYLSSPYPGLHHTSSSTLLTKQRHQQQVWVAELAAQYRPGVTCTAMNQFPSWLNGREDPNLIPCLQSVSSLEVVGPKYGSIPQQQHQPQLVAIASSLPPLPRVKRLDRHLPSVYEEMEGGFHTSGALPLQLLCNERL